MGRHTYSFTGFVGGSFVTLALVFSFMPTPPVLAQSQTASPQDQQSPSLQQTSPEIIDGLCKGVNLDTESTCEDAGITDENQVEDKFTEFIARFIKFVSVLIGAVAVLMIIFGGFRYITSGGDSNNVNAAKNTILYAIVGLVIVALAQVIVRFVLNQLAD